MEKSETVAVVVAVAEAVGTIAGIGKPVVAPEKNEENKGTTIVPPYCCCCLGEVRL